MPQGAAAQYVARGDQLNRVLAAYERALVDSGFEIRRRDPWGPAGFRCKAIWGSKATAVLVKSFVPFGSLMKSGKRLGAEAEIYQNGADVVFRVAVVPYMELFDSPEIFLLSQGVFEKITDDGFSRQKLTEILGRVGALGVRLG
ncbi:MAG: hypothetical protein E6K10_09245 [Methanobacteriota archaeon]|nr:MAG: hypothetical protein E6K10_09245 [Euryarchaeota archaeon]